MTMSDRKYTDQHASLKKAPGLDFVPEARDEDSEFAYVKPAVGSTYYQNSYQNTRRASVSQNLEKKKYYFLNIFFEVQIHFYYLLKNIKGL